MKSSYQGDISIGDYWWCKSSDRALDNNKGTSTVLANNPKGMELFEKAPKKVVVDGFSGVK